MRVSLTTAFVNYRQAVKNYFAVWRATNLVADTITELTDKVRKWQIYDASTQSV